jgi:diguanylate cyclase (GGDEF)-like protein
MKVLVLASDARERALIQSALERGRHDVVAAGSVDEALALLKTDRPRLAILDEDATPGPRAEFLAQAAGQPPIYILSLTSSLQNPTDTDDTMRKPFSPADLAARLSLAQRFLALGDSLSEAREQIETLAMYDGLTGLMNRSAFFRVAQGELERARRTASPMSVIVLDLDSFHDLNQTYGMAAGDEALKAVAAIIRERSRPYDCLGRWAGDEFVAALPGVIGDDAEKIAARIIKGVVAAEVLFEGLPLTLGMSAGIASIIQIHATTEIQPLIEQARQATNRAKERGGNQVLLTFA